jgi:hypothetical protein
MKSITEFPTHKLLQGQKAKAALAADGKTPEEIQQNLGETFKMEGDKLKHFFNAINVAEQNLEGLSRVLVVSYNEGENIPPKAMKVEEHHYVPEFITGVRPGAPAKTKKDAMGNKRDGKRSGPKESPWGLSPEQKAAKKAAGMKKETSN